MSRHDNELLSLTDEFGDQLCLSVDPRTPGTLDLDLYCGSDEGGNHELTKESAAKLRDAIDEWLGGAV